MPRLFQPVGGIPVESGYGLTIDWKTCLSFRRPDAFREVETVEEPQVEVVLLRNDLANHTTVAAELPDQTMGSAVDRQAILQATTDTGEPHGAAIPVAEFPIGPICGH